MGVQREEIILRGRRRIMNYKIKEYVVSFIRGHKTVFRLAKGINGARLNLIYCIMHYKNQLYANIRRKNQKYNKFSYLKKYKNLHENERCFVVCTGPSLRVEDLDKLKNEYTFSMNNIFQLFSRTKWRPTYYCLIDRFVYDKLNEFEEFKKIENAFIPDSFTKRYKKISLRQYNLIPVDFSESRWPMMKKAQVRFSEDIDVVVYDFNSVTYTALQIAVYMGFKEIYLIGCDFDYSGTRQHFEDYGIEVNRDYHVENRAVLGYEAAKDYADRHCIKIFNATRGGKLEIFERVDFDTLV